MNCHSFKKDMTILGTAFFAGYFAAFCDLLYGFLRLTLRLTLKTYRELLELVSRDQ